MIDGVLELDVDGRSFVFAIEAKARAPYPNEVERLESQRARVAAVGHPLLAAPFITSTVGEVLAAAGWSWADEHGNYSLSAPGLRLRRRLAAEPELSKPRVLPTGSGSSAIIRQLVSLWLGAQGPSVTQLASMARVSQPRASQVLARLAALGLVYKSVNGAWTVDDREALLDRFLAEYRGPGGSKRHLYSLDPPLVTARRAALAAEGREIAVSADIGPDLIAAWRRPTMLVVYCWGDLSDEALGAVPAVGRESANVILSTPRDRSVFPVPQLVSKDVVTNDGIEIPLADPTQMVWDLLDLGGADREEAAGVMREWILNRP